MRRESIIASRSGNWLALVAAPLTSIAVLLSVRV
jgi:hypothetical protein